MPGMDEQKDEEFTGVPLWRTLAKCISSGGRLKRQQLDLQNMKYVTLKIHV